MPPILNVANWLLPMLYLGLLIAYGSRFFLRTAQEGVSFILPFVVAAHAAFLVSLGYVLGRPVPVNNYEVLSVVAAATAGVYWIIELISRQRRTGVFVMLAVFLLQYTSSVFFRCAGETAGHMGQLHILPAIVAYTAFTISAVYSALHLLARRDLKQRRFGVLFDRLPSLDALGLLNWHAILIGFIFISVAIVTGATMYASGTTHMDAKTLVRIFAGAAAWLIYAGAIIGRLALRWDFTRVSVLSIAGFIVVAAMLVASIVLS